MKVQIPFGRSVLTQEGELLVVSDLLLLDQKGRNLWNKVISC